jgi:hypothetical protein
MTSLSTLMVLAQAAANPVGSGRIQGGWDYVVACYSITVVAFVLYSLSLWLRRPRASQDSKE